MELSPELIAGIASGALVLLIALGVFGKVTVKLNAVKESVDVLTATIAALSDGKVTADEVGKIKVEIEEAKAAWKK